MENNSPDAVIVLQDRGTGRSSRLKYHLPRCVGAGWLALYFLIVPGAGLAQSLREYETPYYVIHTDLKAEDAREAVIRMTRMFEEYRTRTQGFSGEIQKRFEFYLYKNKEDYLQAGGPPGSAGIFSGSLLMATAGGEVSPRTWRVVQHEGFHQFAKGVIRGDLPTWLNEGLAEYFGESLFTGDSYYTGLIPPKRLARLQDAMKSKQLKSFNDLISMPHDQWNRKLLQENYDQAWSIVYYLVHGDKGRYQTAFSKYILALGQGLPSAKALRQAGLPDLKNLEQQWSDWWLAQPVDPTADQLTEAYAQTFASYLARAASQHQGFSSFEQFAKAGKAGKVGTASMRNGVPADSWLPSRLLSDAIDAATQSPVKWSIQQTSSGGRGVTADCPDGARVLASCLFRIGEPAEVTGRIIAGRAPKSRGN